MNYCISCVDGYFCREHDYRYKVRDDVVYPQTTGVIHDDHWLNGRSVVVGALGASALFIVGKLLRR